MKKADKKLYLYIGLAVVIVAVIGAASYFGSGSAFQGSLTRVSKLGEKTTTTTEQTPIRTQTKTRSSTAQTSGETIYSQPVGGTTSGETIYSQPVGGTTSGETAYSQPVTSSLYVEQLPISDPYYKVGSNTLLRLKFGTQESAVSVNPNTTPGAYNIAFKLTASGNINFSNCRLTGDNGEYFRNLNTTSTLTPAFNVENFFIPEYSAKNLSLVCDVDNVMTGDAFMAELTQLSMPPFMMGQPIIGPKITAVF
jgi:hypothetical protein